jgi:hypothetical protein
MEAPEHERKRAMKKDTDIEPPTPTNTTMHKRLYDQRIRLYHQSRSVQQDISEPASALDARKKLSATKQHGEEGRIRHIGRFGSAWSKDVVWAVGDQVQFPRSAISYLKQTPESKATIVSTSSNIFPIT